MILDISDSAFRRIFDDEKLFLPLRWNGTNFSDALSEQFGFYIERLAKEGLSRTEIDDIQEVPRFLLEAVQHYLNGFPEKAYYSLEKAMRFLMTEPLRIYQKSATELFKIGAYSKDPLNLFRAVCVEDNKPYGRERVFHTPYTLRSKVSTSRYSIAGYPSLYLGTSLELCCEEIHKNPYQDLVLASGFKLERYMELSHVNIQAIELGVKPQDFIQERNESNKRFVERRILDNRKFRSAYLLWYPLIASCSYIRSNKNDPFAAEYIIPQLLMQWVRNEMEGKEEEQLIGIRYFSCASNRASEMGFNYVFPTSGKPISNSVPYCSVLAKAFLLTEPVYVHEYNSIRECENELSRMKGLGRIRFH